MTKNKNNSKFWDERLNNEFDEIQKSFIYRNKLKTVLKNIKNEECNLLDVGVGYGFMEKLLYHKKNKINLYGVDFAAKTIKSLNKSGIGNFSVSRINKLKYKPDFFKYVLALDVFEHVSEDEVLESLSQIHYISKTDMKLIISVPINEIKKDSDNNLHVQKYNYKKLITQLGRSGFILNRMYTLVAFRNHFLVKSIINNLLKIKKPNLLIVIAQKK